MNEMNKMNEINHRRNRSRSSPRTQCARSSRPSISRTQHYRSSKIPKIPKIPKSPRKSMKKKNDHRPRPFVCTEMECNSKFLRRDLLNSHIRNDHNGNPWKCQNAECDEAFKYKEQLKKHENTVHSAGSVTRFTSKNRTKTPLKSPSKTPLKTPLENPLGNRSKSPSKSPSGTPMGTPSDFHSKPLRRRHDRPSRPSRVRSSASNQRVCGKEDVTPWSFGQHIVLSVQDDDDSNDSDSDSESDTVKRHKAAAVAFSTATIRDYDPKTKLSHIWHETKDHKFEDVDLLHLEDWDIATTKPLSEQMQFVPDDEWIPVNWEMGQRVSVKFDGKFGRGLEFTAFIDGFDPQSRRHHINYGDTTEWIWATRDRVAVYDGECEQYVEELRREFKRTQKCRAPPPWNPKLYGLSGSFTARSRELEKRRIKLVEHRKTRDSTNLVTNSGTNSLANSVTNSLSNSKHFKFPKISKPLKPGKPLKISKIAKGMKGGTGLKVKRKGVRIQSVHSLPQLKRKEMVSTRDKRMNITMRRNKPSSKIPKRTAKGTYPYIRKAESPKLKITNRRNRELESDSEDDNDDDVGGFNDLVDELSNGSRSNTPNSRDVTPSSREITPNGRFNGNFRKFRKDRTSQNGGRRPNGGHRPNGSQQIFGNKSHPKRVEFITGSDRRL